jgi:hypothetical protein
MLGLLGLPLRSRLPRDQLHKRKDSRINAAEY